MQFKTQFAYLNSKLKYIFLLFGLPLAGSIGSGELFSLGEMVCFEGGVQYIGSINNISISVEGKVD